MPWLGIADNADCRRGCRPPCGGRTGRTQTRGRPKPRCDRPRCRREPGVARLKLPLGGGSVPGGFSRQRPAWAAARSRCGCGQPIQGTARRGGHRGRQVQIDACRFQIPMSQQNSNVAQKGPSPSRRSYDLSKELRIASRSEASTHRVAVRFNAIYQWLSVDERFVVHFERVSVVPPAKLCAPVSC